MKHARTILLLSAFLGALDAAATSASIGILKPETCGNANGELSASLSGNPIYLPLTYLWSNGGTTSTIAGLTAGNYSVTITDAQGTDFIANAVLTNVSALPGSGQSPSFAGDPYDLFGYTGAACAGQCNGVLGMPMGDLGGTPPFAYSFDVANNFVGTSSYGHPVFSGFCALDQVAYTMTDAFGCAGSGTFIVPQIDQDRLPYIVSIDGACVGSAIGAIEVSDGSGAFTHLLSLYSGGNLIAGPLQISDGEMHTFTGLAPGTYELVSVPDYAQCQLTQYPEVTDLGPGCTQVTGTSWYDANGDCLFDGGEIGVPGSVLLIQPGSQYAITGNDGNFAFNLPAGNYTLAQTDPTLDPYCPATMPAPFTVNAAVVNIDLANNSTAPLDLRIHAETSNAQPGFAHNVYATVVNSTIQATGLVTVTCALDPLVDYVSATPTPLLVSGNVVTWEIAELDYFATQGLTVQTTVPVATPLGTVLTHSLSVTSVAADADPSNNTDQATRVVQGSYDPNDKTAVTSTRASDVLYYIDEDEWLDYTIRFQNTGTASATWVTVTDTLPGTLDMATFQMGVASHAQAVTFKPGRVVEWYFDNIMLPNSSSNEPGSHGFVKFRIKPQGPLVAGTVIDNTANIFFDFNPPVITEPSVLTVEFSTGVGESNAPGLSLSPVPAADLLNVRSTERIETVVVIANDGREVMRRAVRGVSASIHIAELNAGAYVLLATLNNGSVVRKHFIKL